MAHILLAWELGANRGHAVEMAGVARLLQAGGHRVSFAVRRLDIVRVQGVPEAPIWQAPVSPRMLAGGGSTAYSVHGMADILARLGFDDAVIVAGMVEAWRHLLDAVRPDLVIADYAPFLLLAARGRLPSISMGTGFSSPPSGMATLPRLIPGEGIDQAALLANVNAGLKAVQAPPIAALPQIFAADRELAATLAELDPYAAVRPVSPALPQQLRDVPLAGEGDEVFVYMHEQVPADTPLWKGLAASKLKTRIYVAQAARPLREAIAAHGFEVESAPVPWADIAARSRLVISHGGHGFVCAALAAGLPQVVCHYDLEKAGHGLAIAKAGVGGHVPLGTIKPEPFARSLTAIYEDAAFAARARDLAGSIRGREGVLFHDAMRAAVAELS